MSAPQQTADGDAILEVRDLNFFYEIGRAHV